MKEDFIHYLWKFKQFDCQNISTINGDVLKVLDFGKHNQQHSGPDFFNAQIQLGHEKWAGNVEMHLKSSDWYVHKHEEDTAYDNVILHVVWEHDVDVFRKDGSKIPALNIADFTDKGQLQKYQALITKQRSEWIYCEDHFSKFDDFLLDSWLERVFIERLEQKSKLIYRLLNKSTNNWDEVLFKLLAKNFGLNINGNVFLEMAESIPFKVIQKTAASQQQLEALLFGQLNLLNETIEEPYYQNLQKEYHFLRHKYQLKQSLSSQPQFFRLRPGNFPTIRIAQLATLYHKHDHLFNKLTRISELKEVKSTFKISASEFWRNHYTFSTKSKPGKRQLSPKFIDLLLINTFVPLRFAYAKSKGYDENDLLIDFMTSIASEKNQIISKFEKLRKGVSRNALHSQALKQLKTNYCDLQGCLNCNLGIAYLK
ncbi:MAG: DUF2851 family protein [Psychroflexus sp.]|nr:DUF2851 family protein [Psychroflexus sp.]